jgi:hypothetical protein
MKAAFKTHENIRVTALRLQQVSHSQRPFSGALHQLPIV